MRLILLHGDDYKKSFDRLETFIDSAKKRNWNIERLSSQDNISDALISQSLFGEEKLFIIEDADRINKGKIKWMTENLESIEGTLVLYSKKSLNKTFIKSLPELKKIEEYKLPKIIWSFLDSLYPGNSRNSLKLFHKLLEHEAAEFIFNFVARQVRDMYFLKIAHDSLDYPSWRKGKLIAQARKFNGDQLERLVKKLSDADIKSKTSKGNIAELLDYIIITELE